jgi:hypothetical protein
MGYFASNSRPSKNSAINTKVLKRKIYVAMVDKYCRLFNTYTVRRSYTESIKSY